MTNRFEIRTACRAEIDIAIEWAAQEGWNPGLQDADCYFAADPDGFLIGFLDDEPIACISAVKHGADFGFIGFYIVKPAYRGQGYGMQLWRAALNRLASRTIGLDGVVAQQHNYKKSGFSLAHRNVRYAGLTGFTARSDVAWFDLNKQPLADVLDYDRAFFPTERRAFLHAWLQQSECLALGVVQNNTLAGYGVIRRCRTGYKIGPLFADDLLIADTLFYALQSQVQPNTPLFLDVPEPNQLAIDLAHRYAMRADFETARMYFGNAPELPLARIYGVTSFEVG